MKQLKIQTKLNNHLNHITERGCQIWQPFFMGLNARKSISMLRTIIITAGGIGKRMGGKLPKQFLELQGKPVLFHTISCFHTFDSSAQILISLPSDWQQYWIEICEKYQFSVPHVVVLGGKERFHSIQNALLEAQGKWIAVHDGVRPFPSQATIANCFKMAEQKGNAIPVIAVKESIRKLNGDQSTALIRSEYRLVQTPQVFEADLLRKAYKQPYHEEITDDSSLVEALGETIYLVDGNEENIKITNPSDLIFAEAILQNQLY